MNPTEQDIYVGIKSGQLASILRGEQCVFVTPSSINDDMRPTDHDELLTKALYPLAIAHGKDFIQTELEQALRDICGDALGVFCAHQCFYIEIVKENGGRSPLSLNRDSLPKYLASSFMRQSPALHLLELRQGDLAIDRSYKVTVAGMRILARDYGVDWGIILPAL